MIFFKMTMLMIMLRSDLEGKETGQGVCGRHQVRGNRDLKEKHWGRTGEPDSKAISEVTKIW